MIEGFELDGRPEVLAVQWHPEMLAEQPDPAFAWLVESKRPPEFCVPPGWDGISGSEVDGFDGAQDRSQEAGEVVLLRRREGLGDQ